MDRHLHGRGRDGVVEDPLIHGGNIYDAARHSTRAALDFCDFSASINPLGIPPQVQRVFQKVLPKVSHYPDPHGHELREAIARYHRVQPENVLLGNGAMEIIYHLPQALNIRHGLVVGPTFSEYERSLGLAGSRVTNVLATSADAYSPPIDQVINVLKKSRRVPASSMSRHTPVDAVFLCNPNNPTGQGLSRPRVHQLLRDIKRHQARLIVDETFVDFCEERSVVRRAMREEALLVLRSFTKFFGIPGLRIGYAVGSRKVLQAIRKRLPPWSVNVVAQEVASACLSDRNFRERSVQFIQKERDRFVRRLRRIPDCQVFPSSANFLLVELPPAFTNQQVAATFMAKGFLVRDCSNFRGLNQRTIRVAVRTARENARLLELLRKMIGVKK